MIKKYQNCIKFISPNMILITLIITLSIITFFLIMYIEGDFNIDILHLL